MAGPYVDPKKAAEVSKGASRGIGPAEMAGNLAQAFSQALRGGKPPAAPLQQTAVSDPSLLSYENAPLNKHQLNMQQAAEAARLKYMQENGVDENGDPVPK